ncbi:hypothetical protein [Streptomyces sp. NPDC101393]|uniref:hypothetical protein n=1 Tax=Streptomyces sp. NPDC101393 TaxID=3366141 RepID=UPI003804A813
MLHLWLIQRATWLDHDGQAELKDDGLRGIPQGSNTYGLPAVRTDLAPTDVPMLDTGA